MSGDEEKEQTLGTCSLEAHGGEQVAGRGYERPPHPRLTVGCSFPLCREHLGRWQRHGIRGLWGRQAGRSRTSLFYFPPLLPASARQDWQRSPRRSPICYCSSLADSHKSMMPKIRQGRNWPLQLFAPTLQEKREHPQVLRCFKNIHKKIMLLENVPAVWHWIAYNKN